MPGSNKGITLCHLAEFTVKGPHSVHLAGYLMPDIEDMEGALNITLLYLVEHEERCSSPS